MRTNGKNVIERGCYELLYRNDNAPKLNYLEFNHSISRNDYYDFLSTPIPALEIRSLTEMYYMFKDGPLVIGVLDSEPKRLRKPREGDIIIGHDHNRELSMVSILLNSSLFENQRSRSDVPLFDIKRSPFHLFVLKGDMPNFKTKFNYQHV